jgi:hypothetical protein
MATYEQRQGGAAWPAEAALRSPAYAGANGRRLATGWTASSPMACHRPRGRRTVQSEIAERMFPSRRTVQTTSPVLARPFIAIELAAARARQRIARTAAGARRRRSTQAEGAMPMTH